MSYILQVKQLEEILETEIIQFDNQTLTQLLVRKFSAEITRLN